jgi:Flp pilus assembly protein TadD
MRNFSRLAFALLFGASLAMANDLQEASRLLKAGQPQQALESVNKVLAAKPRDPQARFLRGLILTEQGNTREAIDVFTRLTQDYPDLPEPYNNLAVIYASQGEYDKARTALERSIRTHPSYATAYENLGDVYAKLASQAYGKALQLDASNTGAKNKLSLVRELVGTPAPAAPAVVAQAKEPAKPAAKEPAKPAVVEKPKPAPAADATPEILKTVAAWAEAWSKKDVDAYLAHYAKDFKTPGGEARASWEKARRARITAPKSIAVTVASPKVTVQGADAASVSFRQGYVSDVLKANSAKTLVLVRADGRWLIREEKSGN